MSLYECEMFKVFPGAVCLYFFIDLSASLRKWSWSNIWQWQVSLIA